MTFSQPRRDAGARAAKPVIGVLCCNEVSERPIQAVATRFIEPLVHHAGLTVVLIPAVASACDTAALVSRLDGLLLTGSRSNVSASRYGARGGGDGLLDEQRDEVALLLAGEMIETGKPVFGICRGLQELNVLFGGTLTGNLGDGHHRPGEDEASYESLFDHYHDVDLVPDGVLAMTTTQHRLSVNSIHRQGIDRLGSGLRIEAVAAADGLIEAFSARPCGGDVLAVQWHPEWDAGQSAASRAFFGLVGRALAGGRETGAEAHH